MIRGYATDSCSCHKSFQEIDLDAHKRIRVTLEPIAYPQGISIDFSYFLSELPLCIFRFTDNGWHLFMKTNLGIVRARAVRRVKMNEMSRYTSEYMVEVELPSELLVKDRDFIEYLFLTMVVPPQDGRLPVNGSFQRNLAIARLSEGITSDSSLLDDLYEIWVSSPSETLPVLVENIGIPLSIYSYKGYMVTLFRTRNLESIDLLFNLDKVDRQQSFIIFFTKVKRKFVKDIIDFATGKNIPLINPELEDNLENYIWIGSIDSLDGNYNVMHYVYGKLNIEYFKNIFKYLTDYR